VLSGAYSLTPRVRLLVGDRFRHVDIGPGAVTSLPSIQERFTAAEVPGIDGFTTHAQQLGLIYSSLDDPVMPTRGVFGRAAFEISSTALGSSATYRHYTVEVKAFLPWADARYVTAVRAAYNQTLGDDVPFLERSILGGKNTLRGHGDNRFVDSSYVLVNIEERIRLFRYRVFNVNTDWEVAPFLDLGTVATDLLDVAPKNFVVNPGVGFRAIVRPNVVARVDIGFGKEGPAIFATLGYPF
jgi:outer membrane protein assembly factor BamA